MATQPDPAAMLVEFYLSSGNSYLHYPMWGHSYVEAVNGFDRVMHIWVELAAPVQKPQLFGKFKMRSRYVARNRS